MKKKAPKNVYQDIAAGKIKPISNLVKKGGVVLEVTIKRTYAFDIKVNGWTAEQIIQNFFNDYDINSSHASRDYYHVGNADIITGVKNLKAGELLAVEKKRIKDSLKKANKPDSLKPSDYEYCPHCHDSFSFRKCGKDFICPWCKRDVRKSNRIA